MLWARVRSSPTDIALATEKAECARAATVSERVVPDSYGSMTALAGFACQRAKPLSLSSMRSLRLKRSWLPDTLAKFWSSVMLTAGTYKGNPVAKHPLPAAAITPAMFDRWLQLWGQTSAELLHPDQADLIQQKAERIADSLKLALFFTGRPFCSRISSIIAQRPGMGRLRTGGFWSCCRCRRPRTR